MLYRLNFVVLMSFFIYNPVLQAEDPCEEEMGFGFRWNEETESCMHDFEILCREAQKDRASPLARTIQIFLNIAHRADCHLAYMELKERKVIEIHASDFKDITPLLGFDKLEILSFSETSVDDKSIQKLTRLPNLQSIDISQTKIRNPVSLVNLVQTQSKLRFLFMRNLPVEDVRVMYMLLSVNFPELKIKI